MTPTQHILEQLELLQTMAPYILEKRPHYFGPFQSPQFGGVYFQRKDGLLVLVTIQRTEQREWLHVSLSFANKLPTHQDMRSVRGAFFAENAVVVQVFPPEAEYVNDNPFVLHLWQRLGPDRLVPDLRILDLGRRSI